MSKKSETSKLAQNGNASIACVGASTDHSPEAASQAALEFCELNKDWKRICDLDYDSNELYQTWDDLTAKEKKHWFEEYGRVGAKAAWEEFGTRKCKVPMLLIDGTGFTYTDIRQVPRLVNTMTTYMVGR